MNYHTREVQYTHGFALSALIALIAAVILLGGGGVYVLTQNKQTPQPENKEVIFPQATSTAQNQNMQVANWKTYTNTKYGFSFKYPPTWCALEVSDSDLSFSKSPCDNNSVTPSAEDFANFSVSDYSDRKEGAKPVYVTPEKYFSYYYPADEATHLTTNVRLTREWISLAGIPVFTGL